MAVTDKDIQELLRQRMQDGTLSQRVEENKTNASYQQNQSYSSGTSTSSSGKGVTDKDIQNILRQRIQDGTLASKVYGEDQVNLSNRYDALVNNLKNTANNYGKTYGQQRDNRGIFYQARRDYDNIRLEAESMLTEIDDLDLDYATKKSWKEAIEELIKATDSASLDARSRIAAYNNPATQRLMQGYDDAAFSATQYSKLLDSPMMQMTNALNEEMGGSDNASKMLAQNTYDPIFWQYESNPIRQNQMLDLLAQRYGSMANQMPRGSESRVEYLQRATDAQNTKAQLQAQRDAESDEKIMAEVERLKGISTDTAIRAVRQTIDDLDEKAARMQKYWGNQSHLDDGAEAAPDYAEYEKLLEERAKYESILDGLYNDKDSEEMSGYTWADDSIVRSHLSENYNATNLYDRVNKAYFDTTVDFGVEYTPNRGVKTSSYPIAQRPENYMTQEERDTFNKLWHYESEEAATAYFERLTPTLEARGAQQVMGEAKQFTEDYPNWAWVQARGANAMKPISSAFMIGDILGGEGVRENSAANVNTSAANFVDSYAPEVTNYTGNTKFLGRDLDQFLYSTVGSTVDSAVRMMTASFIGGSGAGASLKENAQGVARATGALMSLEVFPSVVLEEKEKGRSDTQAVLLGAVRAAIEGFTEKYSVELLFSPSKTIGGFLLKGAAAEGSEEIAATVLNGVVDIIAADRDNILQEWDRRTAMGLDPIEALADILVERGESTLADGMSGALSGLLFSAGGAASGAMTPTTKSAERMAQSVEVTEALVKRALAENPNNRVALKAQEDLAAGKTISAKTVQKLIESNESVYRKDDQQTIASFVASELTNRGEVTAVNETANAIAKAVVGENLSDGDLRAIENSVFGKQLYNEVTGQTKGGEWLNQLRDNLDVVEIARPQTQRETKPTAAKRVTVKNADATTKDGTAVQIVGLEAQTDGTTKVKVKGSDGTVKAMAASELELNEISKDLIEGVAKFKGAAPAIYAAYMPTNDVGTYLNDVEYIVTAANGVAADNNGATILDYLKNSKHISDLADVQIETIFNAALAEGRKALAEAQPLSTSGSGQFTYTAKRAESSLKGREAAATVFMQALVKVAPNIDIEVFESTARIGKYIGEQGSYSDGKIRIDLNAGKNFTYDVAESAMLRTLSHELTHHLQRTAPKQYADLKAFVIKHLAEWNGGTELDDLISAKQRRSGGKLSYAAALDEVVADSCEMMLKNSAAVKQLAVENKGLFSKIRDFVKKFLSDLRRAFAGVEANDAAAKYLKKFETEMQKLWDEAFTASVQNAKMTSTAIPAANTLMNPMQETEFSLRENEKFMQNAIKANEAKQLVPYRVMTAAQNARSAIAEIMRDPKLQDALNLPADLMGKTYFPDGAYNGTEENTLVCPRSMGAEELLDAVSEMIGRPLTVDECIEVSQFIAGSEFKPECEYCYVATDRKAYRAFLKSYIEQRDSVIEKYKGGMNKAALYEEFLDGRKDTKNMRDRFNLWIKVVDQNLPMMQASDLTNVNNLMHDIIEPGIKDQVKDAMKYAQSASWAKKRVGYTAYNGHILKWSQTKINQLNKGFGLRMYSFSDFSPAFILENMQMITDASVRGLKMMAYTKEADFVKIFAPTGININVSTFGFERNGVVAENAMQGVSWKEAQELRAKYPNVGITFVATNDDLVNWALEQDWIDVVIPYHLVRTGKQVAERLGFTNYTSESGDIKASDWTKGRDMSSIPPTMHNNDKQTYLNALEENHLQPRFKRWLDHPNYMKLVNETRLSSLESKPVQPKFDLESAKKSLIGMIKDGGYFQHIGGSVDRMYEIASGIAEKFDSGTQFSERDHIATRDSLGNELSEQQQKFFAKSKAVDRNGKLVLLYHGTTNGGFTVFDPQFSDDKLSLFAADNLNMAFTYSGSKDVLNLPKGKPAALRWTEGSGTKGKGQVGVYQVYYNLTNPLIIDGHGENWDNLSVGEHDVVSFRVSQASGGSMYGDVPVVVEITTNGRTRTTSFSSVSEMRSELTSKYNSSVASAVASKTMRSVQSGNEVTHKIHWSNETHKEVPTMTTRDLAKKAKAEGYDGLIARNIIDSGKYGKRTDSERGTIYVAFDSNQIKSVDNKNPTSHKDIRYSERDYEAAEIARLEQRIEALEQGKADAFLAGEMRVARQAGKETRRLTEKIDTLKGKLEEAKQTAKDTKKASAEERKAANLRAKNLEAQIKKLTKEAEASGFLAGEMSVARQAGAEIRNREDQIRKLKAELADRKAAYRENISTYRVGRQKAAVIESIKRLETNLQNQLLGKGGKGAYVPVNLVNSAIGVARLLDTSGSPTYTRNGEVRESQTYKKYVSVKEALLDLQDQYNQLPQNPDPEYAQEYTSEFASMLTELRNAIGDKNVHDMTLAQLQDVYSILRQLTYTLIDAKKQIGKMDARTNYEIGTEIMDEMKAVQGKDGSIFRQMGHTMNLNVTSPLRNINRMTGYIENSALVELFSDINDGIKRQNAFRMDANKMFDELRAGDLADVYATACNKLVEFDILDEDGNKVQMTMMQAMQLLLSYEREASNEKLHHLERGGAIIPDHKLLQKGKLSDATLKGTVIPTFTPEDAQKIRDAVKAYHDAYGTKFVEVSRQFFNSLAKDAINDTTMITHHRPVATDKNYIPFSVDQGTVSKELEGLKYDSTIEGSGILKSVKPQASNPLVIVGLNHVIDRHIEDVARIYGLSIPIRNFNKVWNVKTIGSNMTTKKAVGYAWGAEGQKMIEQTITDLQTSREKPSDIVSKALNAMQSNFVKATLLSNISVTIKQAASYSVAGLHLSQRALAPYQTTVVRLFAAPEGKFAQDLFDEIDTYTPEHWIRRQGMSTQELGDLAQRQGKLVELERQIPTALNPVKWIQNMDVATTAALWLACKKQVQLDGNTKVGTDAYWTAVTELYERVIEETQPMYDVLHRPEVQKTTNALVRNVVMFKTQPLQNSGVLFDTYGEMVAARKGNDKGRAKAATQKFSRAVFSQVASLAVFSTMSLLAYAVKHKIGRYRDDDDELTAGSVLWRMVQDMMSSAAGLLLPVGGTELYDFIDRRIGGSSFGDSISVPTVQILNEFLDASGKMIDVFTKEDAEGWENALWEFAERTAAITAGLPIQNVANIIDGIRLSIKDIQKGVFPVFNNTNVDRENSTNYDRLWGAIVDGDAAKYGEVYDEVYTNLTTKDEKTARDARADIASGITERVKEAFYAGEIDEATASKYLSEYGGKNSDEISSMILKWKLKVETGMDYDDLSDEFVKGEISADEFKNFLMNYGGAKEEDAEATVQRALMEKEVGIAYDDMKDEFLNGKLSDADARNYLAKYGGKSETAIDKTLSEWSFEKAHGIAYGDMKQAFIDGEISRNEAVVYRMEYGGAKEADAEATVTEWEFEKKHGYAYADMRSEFVAGRLSEENAIAYRVEYGGQTEKEAAKTVSEWKLEKEAGVEYDDIRSAFVSGDITAEQAVEYRTQFGGQTKKDAQADVQKWQMEIDTGIVYDDMKEAFLAGDVTDEEVISYRTTYGGQTTKEAEATLAEWKFEQATGLPQIELKGAFVDGEFTADEAEDMLVDYAGKSRKDAEADVAKWQMEVDTGYSYDDMRSLYLEGDITKNDVISYQQKYGGKTSEAAQETANEYEFEKTYGWAYGDKATLYKGGDITSSELRSALMGYGGMTSEEADLQIKVYDLEEQGYTNVTAARIKDYDEFCASSGVPYQTYFDLCKTQSNTENDKDENGKTINYSAVQKIMEEINATTLTSEQKTAVALSFWKESTVNKYRLW